MNRGNTLPKPKKVIMSQIHNRFDIEVIDALTGEVKQRAKAENVILDNIWRVFSSYGWFEYIAYGKGSGVPSPSDKGLFSLVGIAGIGAPSDDFSHVSEGYISRTKHASLSETAAVGVTITELGLCTSTNTSNTVICTHAMLTDMNGNPISILKTDTDIINLYATVFFHWNLDGYNGVEFLPYEGSFPPFSMTGSVGLTFSKSKSVGGGISGDSAKFVYDQSTKSFTCTSPRITVSQLNIGGFQYVTIGSYFIAKIQGPHRVVGESVGTGNGSTTDFTTKYDLPSNAVVYVDGVIEQSATVSEEPIHHTDMGKYFWRLHEASTVNRLIPTYGNAPTNQFNPDSWTLYGIGLFYNPFYELGIDSYSFNDLQRLETSNDLIHWEIIYDYTDKVNKPITDFRNHKFWRTSSRNSQYSGHYWGSLKCNSLTGKNIHFATPPAKGAVITIDYDTPMVPKDENHVFDFEMVVQFGAYGEN